MKVLNWVFSVGERLPCTLQGVAQHPWTLASPITAMKLSPGIARWPCLGRQPRGEAALYCGPGLRSTRLSRALRAALFLQGPVCSDAPHASSAPWIFRDAAFTGISPHENLRVFLPLNSF